MWLAIVRTPKRDIIARFCIFSLYALKFTCGQK